MHHHIFRQTTTATAPFGTKHFQILPSTHLLTRLIGKTVAHRMVISRSPRMTFGSSNHYAWSLRSFRLLLKCSLKGGRIRLPKSPLFVTLELLKLKLKGLFSGSSYLCLIYSVSALLNSPGIERISNRRFLVIFGLFLEACPAIRTNCVKI